MSSLAAACLKTVLLYLKEIDSEKYMRLELEIRKAIPALEVEE